MCLDLNKLLFYGNLDSSLREGTPEQRKRHYVLCDGVIGGEGRGPMNPDPIESRMVVFGTHPASTDAACTWLMGFDPQKVPIVRNSFSCEHLPIAEWSWKDVEVTSNNPNWNEKLPNIPDSSTEHFRPHFGWEGHIERGEEGD
jgi:hypothetical protein